jgi:regulator of protease activity HflC (stomatin/prohibitin superfamily)
MPVVRSDREREAIGKYLKSSRAELDEDLRRTEVKQTSHTSVGSSNATVSDGYESTHAHICRSMFGNLIGMITNCIPCLPSVYHTVPNGQKGLLYRGERYIRTLPAGRYYCNPCTEDIKVIDTARIHSQSVTTTTNRTKDGIDMNLKSRITWSIEKPLQFYNEIGSTGDAVLLMQSKTLQAIREMVALNTAEDIMTLQRKETEKTLDAIQRSAVPNGIRVHELTIDDIDRSEQFKANMMTKAHMEQQNANMLSKAKATAEAAAIRLKTLEMERKVLGDDIFAIVLHERGMMRIADSSNAKVVVFGSQTKKQKDMIAVAHTH